MLLIAMLACADEAALGGPIPTPSADEITERETDGLETFTFSDDNALFFVQLTPPADSKSHAHVVRASGIQGTAQVDSSDWSTLSIEVTLPVEDLLVDEPDMRVFAGLPDDLSEGNRAAIQKHMRAADQLDFPAFSEIHFVSTGYDGTTLSGDMTIHGETAPIQVDLTAVVADEGLYIAGSGTLLGTDHGFEPYTMMSYANPDEIALVIDARGE